MSFVSVTEKPGIRVTREGHRMLIARYAYAERSCAGRDALEVGCGAGMGLGLLATRAPPWWAEIMMKRFSVRPKRSAEAARYKVLYAIGHALVSSSAYRDDHGPRQASLVESAD